MEELAELMPRLLEIQSGGRQRSPELIVEDERLMDGLQKRIWQDSPSSADCRIIENHEDQEAYSQTGRDCPLPTCARGRGGEVQTQHGTAP